MRLSGNARVAVVAAVCYLVPLAVNAVAPFLTTWTGLGSWLVGPTLGVVGAVVTAMIESSGQSPPRGKGDDAGSRTRRSPTAVGVLTVVLAVLVAGGGIALGVRYAVGWITGDETGPEILVEPVTGGGPNVSLTVHGVQRTDHFTRVSLLAHNTGPAPVSLPLFGNGLLIGSDGTTLEADDFRSDWATSLPPGPPQRGVVVFPGHLPDDVDAASLSFATVFGPGGGGSLSVGPLQLSSDEVGAAAGLLQRLTG